MSHDLKTQVLEFLHNLPEEGYVQFNQAFELYKKLPNKNKGSEVSYNRQGYKEQTLKNLLYDLKKSCNISDVEVLEGPKEVVQLKPTIGIVELSEAVKEFVNAFNALDQAIQDSILVFFKAIEDFGIEAIESNPELIEYFKDCENVLNTLSSDFPNHQEPAFSEDLEAYFKTQIVDVQFPEELENILLENKNILPLVPSEIHEDNFLNDLRQDSAPKLLECDEASELKDLRTEFPFLNEKDCPDILLIVVGKRITAFRDYQKLHAELQKINTGIVIVTPEEKLEATENTERAFNENQLLWNELNYYNLNKEILGKHPLFRESNIKRDVESMTNDLMIKFKASSTKYFHDQNKALERYKDDAVKLESVHVKIADRKYKLSLIDAKLGVNAGEKK